MPSPPKPAVSTSLNLSPSTRVDRRNYSKSDNMKAVKMGCISTPHKASASSVPKFKKACTTSLDNHIWRATTSSHRTRTNLEVSSLTPLFFDKLSKTSSPMRAIEAHSIILHFLLGNVALDIISKDWEQCSTFGKFNKEVARVVACLSQARFDTEINLLLADIDSGESGLPLG